MKTYPRVGPSSPCWPVFEAVGFGINTFRGFSVVILTYGLPEILAFLLFFLFFEAANIAAVAEADIMFIKLIYFQQRERARHDHPMQE